MVRSECPAQACLNLLGRKWTGQIVWALMSGRRRFSEIQAAVPGITGRVLSRRLKELEGAGLVIRQAYAEIPPRVEYRLTRSGRSLQPVIEAMARWSQRFGARPGSGASGRKRGSRRAPSERSRGS
jgi:DNA-binding HxlR family transcriptional regulator